MPRNVSEPRSRRRKWKSSSLSRNGTWWVQSRSGWRVRVRVIFFLFFFSQCIYWKFACIHFCLRLNYFKASWLLNFISIWTDQQVNLPPIGTRRSSEGRDADRRGGNAPKQVEKGVHRLQDGHGEKGKRRNASRVNVSWLIVNGSNVTRSNIIWSNYEVFSRINLCKVLLD